MPDSSLGFTKLQMERVRCAEPIFRNAMPREPITEAVNTNRIDLTSGVIWSPGGPSRRHPAQW